MSKIILTLLSLLSVNAFALKARSDNKMIVKDKLLSLSKGTQFVLFYTPNCLYCEKILPTWERLEEEHKSGSKIRVDKVDCSTYRGICKRYSIRSYPTLIWLKDGVSVGTYVGEKSYEKLHLAIEIQSKRSNKNMEDKIYLRPNERFKQKHNRSDHIAASETTVKLTTVFRTKLDNLVTINEEYAMLVEVNDYDTQDDPVIMLTTLPLLQEEKTVSSYLNKTNRVPKYWKIIKPKTPDDSQ